MPSKLTLACPSKRNEETGCRIGERLLLSLIRLISLSNILLLSLILTFSLILLISLILILLPSLILLSFPCYRSYVYNFLGPLSRLFLLAQFSAVCSQVSDVQTDTEAQALNIHSEQRFNIHCSHQVCGSARCPRCTLVQSHQWRTQEFCSGGGVQQIQLRTEDRENGDLGAVAP